MPEQSVKVRLNQQQLELVNRTIEKGEAKDVQELFKRALREYWDKHKPSKGQS